MGHGPTQDTFEKRDFTTTNNMVYENREKVETIINPNNWQNDGKSRSQMLVNGQQSDLPTMFSKNTGAPKSINKAYNQFTGSFDNNSLKMGLRQ